MVSAAREELGGPHYPTPWPGASQLPQQGGAKGQKPSEDEREESEECRGGWVALQGGLGGGQGLPATRGLSPAVSPVPPSWGGCVRATGALAGLEVEGRILLTPHVTRLCCPTDEMRTLEGKPSACLLVFLQLLPSPPEVVGTLGGPGNPGMRPQASPSISPSPRKVGGTAGRVSRRSPQPPSPPQTLSASRFLSSPGCKAHTDVGLSGAIRGLR